MPHRDAVAHADAGDDDGLAACRDDALRRRPCDVVEVHVSGDDVALRRDDAHDGLFHLAVRPAEGAQERALRRHAVAVCKGVCHRNASENSHCEGARPAWDAHGVLFLRSKRNA